MQPNPYNLRLMIAALAVVIGLSFWMNACSNDDCDDDPDCIYINDGNGGHYEEIDVDDGKCECA